MVNVGFPPRLGGAPRTEGKILDAHCVTGPTRFDKVNAFDHVRIPPRVRRVEFYNYWQEDQTRSRNSIQTNTHTHTQPTTVEAMGGSNEKAPQQAAKAAAT